MSKWPCFCLLNPLKAKIIGIFWIIEILHGSRDFCSPATERLKVRTACGTNVWLLGQAATCIREQQASTSTMSNLCAILKHLH